VAKLDNAALVLGTSERAISRAKVADRARGAGCFCHGVALAVKTTAVVAPGKYQLFSRNSAARPCSAAKVAICAGGAYE
jgi:hypothetical protein